jgi:hypothetical protein
MNKPLFFLIDNTPVYEGDVLYHPDSINVGWYCVAEFAPDDEYVTVRSPNGAVPTVRIDDLRKQPPAPPARCSKCGQFLPPEDY